MDLNEIQYFKHVAECGSFTAASRQMNIPKSTLSRKVADLEARLGISLFRRTTRQVKLTDIGQEYLRICQKAMSDLEEAARVAGRGETRPRGKLRIAAPLDIASTLIAGFSAEFCQLYPEIELEFLLDDRIVDLIEEKVDLAIRTGALPDSSLKSQKLGNSEFQLFASQAYLKKFGEPKTPKELENHRCLVFTNLYPGGIWNLTSGSLKQKVQTQQRISSNQLSMVKMLAIHGAGIALIPVFLSQGEEQKKKLVRVLKSWGTDREPVYAVYPAQLYLPARTRLFLEFIKKTFKA